MKHDYTERGKGMKLYRTRWVDSAGMGFCGQWEHTRKQARDEARNEGVQEYKTEVLSLNAMDTAENMRRLLNQNWEEGIIGKSEMEA